MLFGDYFLTSYPIQQFAIYQHENALIDLSQIHRFFYAIEMLRKVF